MIFPIVPGIVSHHGILCIITILLLHTGKTILCICWTRRQAVEYELLPTLRPITADLYWQHLVHVQQALKQKEPALLNRKDALLIHDNVRYRVAQVTSKYIG